PGPSDSLEARATPVVYTRGARVAAALVWIRREFTASYADRPLSTHPGAAFHPGGDLRFLHGPEPGDAGQAVARPGAARLDDRRRPCHGQRHLGHALHRHAGLPPADAARLRPLDYLRLLDVAGDRVRAGPVAV